PDRTLVLDFFEAEIALAAIAELHSRHPLSVVLGVDDESVELAAQANQRLRIPHNSPTSVSLTRDKFGMRQCLAKAGLASPGFQRFSVASDPETLRDSIRYPCVLKPTFLAASQGVIRADAPGEFNTAFRSLQELLADPELQKRGGERAKWVLVEDYLPGLEVSLEGVLTDGCLQTLALFDKPDPLTGPTFAETLYVAPSRLPETVQQCVRKAVEQTAQALGLTTGPVHAEARVHQGKVWMLECAARTIGGLCSRMLAFSGGMSLEALILRHALGRDIQTAQTISNACGALMLPVPKDGTLHTIAGWDTVREISGVEAAVQSLPNGTAVRTLPHDARYLGFVLVREKTPAAVETTLREAWTQLQVEID
ncbi:MAG: ATP-grasp domain-containing protein, partial [SAR324 cluster bacterium]|nr:ATP-grasp domain-containing protein [SAR324 cluster bacterium]